VTAADPGRPLVVLRDASAHYPGPPAVAAVTGATCSVYPGESVALVGPSGSGKSTLLHLMSGLQAPTAGTVRWPGLDEAPRSPGTIGMIFQAPSLLPPLDVTENVALPLLLRGVDPAEAARRALAALDRLDLGVLARKLPEELSGGQAQRVAVARALVSAPQLVLADEPTGQLDRATGTRVLDTLLEAVASAGAALVISTHDPLVAARPSSRWSVRDGVLDTTVREPAAATPTTTTAATTAARELL
jgi:ABC-type lipoprotein export system ATPase subunit